MYFILIGLNYTCWNNHVGQQKMLEYLVVYCSMLLMPWQTQRRVGKSGDMLLA